ncbi:flagellar motor switch phosphatase FliY [Thermodesulfitimonas autotrophica]|uniref:flagellar motor switch phosphatase FliY n=1 Tax=Thermodesulfitimonas autotrophica TaxID=1894989 RepID=UPI002FE001BD
MADRLLKQEEIDALLSGNPEITGPDLQEAPALNNAATGTGGALTEKEKDALGEIGNISMGSAATTLSELLNQKVVITSPRVEVTTEEALVSNFTVPYMIIKVRYTEGLAGLSLLVIKTADVAVIADLMMGGNGQNPPATLGELEISAVAEAMNQMMGAAATAMADIFKRTVNIAPPEVSVFDSAEQKEFALGLGDQIVVIYFRMTVNDLLDTEIMQVLGIETAREQAALLWQNFFPESPAATATASEKQDEAPATDVGPIVPPPEPARAPVLQEGLPVSSSLSVDQRKLELILDIPLKVTVVLGRTKRPIKEILSLGPGSIVELAALANEPVEVLVNGTLVAKGEVVVVNENFGVQITSIVTPQERLQYLAGNR